MTMAPLDYQSPMYRARRSSTELRAQAKDLVRRARELKKLADEKEAEEAMLIKEYGARLK